MLRDVADLQTITGAYPGLRGGDLSSQGAVRGDVSADVAYKMFLNRAKVVQQLRDAESALQHTEATVMAQSRSISWNQSCNEQLRLDYQSKIDARRWVASCEGQESSFRS